MPSVRRTEQALARIAARHAEPSALDEILGQYARTLQGYSLEELQALSDDAKLDAHASAFFADAVKKDPSKAKKRKPAPRAW